MEEDILSDIEWGIEVEIERDDDDDDGECDF